MDKESSLLVGALPGLDKIPFFAGSIDAFEDPTGSSTGVEAPDVFFAFLGLLPIVRSDVVIHISLLDEDDVIVDEDCGIERSAGDLQLIGEILLSLKS